MARVLEDLQVRITGDSKGATTEIGRARQAVAEAQRRMGADLKKIETATASLGAGFRRLTQLAGLFGVALGTRALVNWTASTIDAVGALGELSQQLGVSTDAIQVYRFAASQLAIENSELERGLQRLNRSIGEAASGTKTYADAFALAGVSITDAAGNLRTTDEVFVDLAEQLSRIEDPATRASIAADLLGRNGQALLPLLEQGASGISKFAARARELGVVFSADQIAAADRAADKWAEFGTRLQAIGSQVLLDVTPAIEGLFDTLNQPEVIEAITGLLRGLAKAIEIVAITLGAIGDTFSETVSKGGANVLLEGIIQSTGDLELMQQYAEATGNSIETLSDKMEEAAAKIGKALDDTLPPGGGGLSDEAGKALENFRKVAESVREATLDLDFQASLVGRTAKEVDYLTKRRELLNAALATGRDLTESTRDLIDDIAYGYAEAGERLRELTGAQDEATRKAEEAAKAAKDRVQDFQREVESVAGSISSDLTDALFEGAENGFDNIFASLGKWLQRIALEILEQQFILPITMQLVGAAPGLFGISGGGAGGNGFNIAGALGDTANQIGSWLGLGGSVASGAGAAAFGLVPGGSAAATAGAGFNLGGLLGDFGIGAGIGGILASLTGGGSVGGTIGGGLGSIAGSLAFGPVGGIVGGLLGGFLGGLFGGAPERIGPQSIFEIRGSGGLGPQQIAATQGAGDPSGFGNSIIDAVDNLVAALGGTLGSGQVTTDVGFIEALGGLYVNPTGHYGTAGAGVTAGGTFFGNDAEAARRFAISTILGQAGVAGVDQGAVTALQRSLDIRDSDEEVERDVAVIRLLFDELPDDMGEAERALHDLNEAMDDAAKRARELGLAEEEVEARRAAAIEELKSGFLTSLEDQILALKDPVAFAIEELDRWYEAMIADAEALGVGLAEVEELYALRRKDILERIGQASVDSLQGFLDQIRFGNLSGASPGDTLAGTRAAFEATAAQALAGDVEARGRIQDLGSQFLEASRAFNASGAGFYSDRQRVEDVVRALLGEDAPGYARGTWNHPGGPMWVGEQGKELMFAPPGAAILPNAISRMIEGVANGEGFSGGGIGRALLRVASQHLSIAERTERKLSEHEAAIGRLVSQVSRLISSRDAAA